MIKNMPAKYSFDWNEMAFSSKKPIRQLDSIFIAAPRELSTQRFVQILKKYLPKANIVLGLAKEEYIDKFDSQPQFKTLRLNTVKPIIDKVNDSDSINKIYTLEYFQRDIEHIIDKIQFQRCVLINGSWHQTFHTTPTYYKLVQNNIPYDKISPFVSEKAAKEYANSFKIRTVGVTGLEFMATEMLDFAKEAANNSFDHSFQVGATLGKKEKTKYRYLLSGFNKVVPYQAYAMHHGSDRELNFTPPQDNGHYDTIHAETDIIIETQKAKIDLMNTTLFINLLPCPNCARMICATDIEEVIYVQDYSNGFAIKLLESAGKKVTRIV